MELGTNLGRLRYRTAEEARGAARDLGLDGVHQHEVDGEIIWMPGETHTALNDALRDRGLPPTQMPGGGTSSDLDDLNMTDSGTNDGVLSGGGLFDESDDESDGFLF